MLLYGRGAAGKFAVFGRGLRGAEGDRIGCRRGVTSSKFVGSGLFPAEFLLAKMAFAIEMLFLPLGRRGGEILQLDGEEVVGGVRLVGGEDVNDNRGQELLDGLGGRAGLLVAGVVGGGV